MIYLDYNASAPIAKEVLDTIIQVMSTQVGNADSRTHEYGANSMSIVQQARESAARLFNVKPSQVIFTSGATESNNLAIQGLRKYGLQQDKKHIIVSSIEHKSVLETAKAMAQEGFDVEIINPDPNGRIDVQTILDALRENTLVVALMHVNNETGIIQPVDQLGQELKKRNVLFLVDATQSSGKLVEEIQHLDYDFLTFSAHKLQGPQGIGGLILKNEKPISPIMHGGHQERGFRPGTTPVALAAGLGKACELALSHYKENQAKVKDLKAAVLQILDESKVKYVLNGDPDHCVDSMINVSFYGVSSEALMIMLKGICAISNGSACTSDEYTLSYVLKAMNLPDSQIEDAVRISWGPDTSKDDLVEAMKQICQIASNFQ